MYRCRCQAGTRTGVAGVRLGNRWQGEVSTWSQWMWPCRVRNGRSLASARAPGRLAMKSRDQIRSRVCLVPCHVPMGTEKPVRWSMQFERDRRQSARLCKSNLSLVAWQLSVDPAFSFIHRLILFLNGVLFIHVPFVYCDKRVGCAGSSDTDSTELHIFDSITAVVRSLPSTRALILELRYSIAGDLRAVTISNSINSSTMMKCSIRSIQRVANQHELSKLRVKIQLSIAGSIARSMYTNQVQLQRNENDMQG